MKKLLVTMCAAAALTGPAIAQSPATKNTTQPPAAATTTKPAAGTNAATSGTTNATTSGTSASNPAGIQSMNSAGAVKLNFYTVQPADIRVSKLMGAEVYNLNNENVGEIEDFIIDNGKNIRGVVVSVGGFLGIGDRHIAVQPNSLTTREQNDGGIRVVINTNKEELKNAPQVKLEDIDKRASAMDDSSGATANASADTGAKRSPK